MEFVRADIDHLVADAAVVIADGGVPKGDHAVHRGGLAVVADVVELVSRKRAVERAVAIDLAVEGLGDEVAAQLVPVPSAAGDERDVRGVPGAKAEAFLDVGAVVDRGDLAKAVVVAPEDRLLVEGRGARGGVIGGGDEVPDMAHQRDLGAEIVDLRTIADAEFEDALLIEPKSEALVLVDVPAAEQRLTDAVSMHRRVNESAKRQAAIQGKLS